ncbi:MAG: hypothetical protein ACF8Q5_13495 [Phycisphaerales bacterium JB040]
MLITRKIAKLVRGKATPFQVGAACFLGALLGATPGFTQGPGLYLCLLAVLVVLNANLWVATLVFGLTKLISLVAMPAQFWMGYWIIEGPTQGVVKAAVNAPVLAWFGLDYPAVTGSIPLGLIVGLFATILLSSSLRRTRLLLARLDSKDPEERGRVEKILRENKTARVLAWIFIGKRGKASYADLAKKKIGNPIRPLGALLVLLVGALIALVGVFLQEPLVTYSLQSGLQRANGATVDLDSASVDLKQGQLTATGLAMADPNKLSTDLLRAQTLTADVGNRDLLTRRIAFDLIEIDEASSGKERRTPGILIGDRPEPTEPPEDPSGETKTIDDYLNQAEQWKERLDQVREWLDKMNAKDPDSLPEDPDAPENESWRDRLRREIEAKGYTRVRMDHLVEGAPTVLIRELRINGMTVEGFDDETFDVNGRQLATQPYLLSEGQPTIDLSSRSGNISGTLQLESAAVPSARLAFTRLNLPGDAVGSWLKFTGEPPVRGGSIDLRFDTALSGAAIDGTLSAGLNNTNLSIAGQSTTVDQMTLPIGLSGFVNAPRIAFTDEALKQALLDAGKQELVNRLGEELDKAIGDNEDVKEVTDQIRDRIPGNLGGLLGGNKDEDKDDGGG